MRKKELTSFFIKNISPYQLTLLYKVKEVTLALERKIAKEREQKHQLAQTFFNNHYHIRMG